MISTKNFQLLVANPKLIGDLCNILGDMPNIEMPTAGGKVWWNNLAEYNGWRLQKNKLTGHCRLLDSNDYRKAWGSESSMQDAINRIINSLEQQKEQEQFQSTSANKDELLSMLEKLGHLKEQGFITEEEFIKKKNNILDQI